MLHEGQVVHRANFGYLDIATKTPADSDTIYHIGSMTKAFVTASLAILIGEGRLNWTTTLPELVPEFASQTSHVELPELKTEANVIDLVSHRLGLTQRNMYRLQGQAQLLIEAKETARVLGSLQSINGFRTKMSYNDWAFSLAGMILEDLAGESIGDFCRKKLFDPLGLKRTTLESASPENYVSSYMALSNATPFEVPAPPFVSGKVHAAAAAGKSTINDLLILYKSLLTAASDQLATGKSTTPGSPFVQVSELWKDHIPINNDSTYGLGWVLTHLPVQGGLVGVNAYEADEMPVIAKGTKKRRMIYHQGSMNGALSAVYLLPDSHTAVVVLSNSFDLCDTPDWVAQLLIEALLDCPEPNDFVTIAKRTAIRAVSHASSTNGQLARERLLHTPVRPVTDYTGRYYNGVGNFFLDVIICRNALRLIVQGFTKVQYDMHHYHYDVFSWECDRDAQTKAALWPMSAVSFHKVSFRSGANGEIMQLNWGYDKNFPEGETFYKTMIPGKRDSYIKI